MHGSSKKCNDKVLVLSTRLILQRGYIGLFQGSLGVQHFPGGGGIPMETYRTYNFPDPCLPSLGPHILIKSS